MSHINLSEAYNVASTLSYEDQLALISKLAASLQKIKLNIKKLMIDTAPFIIFYRRASKVFT